METNRVETNRVETIYATIKPLLSNLLGWEGSCQEPTWHGQNLWVLPIVIPAKPVLDRDRGAGIYCSTGRTGPGFPLAAGMTWSKMAPTIRTHGPCWHGYCGTLGKDQAIARGWRL